MATFVMQSLGCEVAAINTVNFSTPISESRRTNLSTNSGAGNHTGYKQVKGRKTTAEEITDLYEGLKQSFLTDFDVLLSGYIPNAAAIRAVGGIGRDLKFNATTKPGSFFWGKAQTHFHEGGINRVASPRPGHGGRWSSLCLRRRCT